MKKISSITAALLGIYSTLACDVCGGAISSANGDVIPGIFSNYIGIGASLRSFSSTHLTLFDSEVPLNTFEHFSVMNLHGRYSPKRRLQIYGNMPVSIVRKMENHEIRYSSGLSDASFRLNYLAIDEKNDSISSFINLLVGSTIKIPTGRFEFNEDEEYYFHRNMLPGTGTFDFGFHLDLLYRKKSVGAAFYGTTIFRGKRRGDYNFGNFYHARLSAFNVIELTKYSLMLDLGIDFSMYEQDVNLRSNTFEVYTGGWMLSPTLRVNYNREKFIFSATAQRPIAQELADKQVLNNYTIQLNIIYLLNSKK